MQKRWARASTWQLSSSCFRDEEEHWRWWQSDRPSFWILGVFCEGEESCDFNRNDKLNYCVPFRLAMIMLSQTNCTLLSNPFCKISATNFVVQPKAQRPLVRGEDVEEAEDNSLWLEEQGHWRLLFRLHSLAENQQEVGIDEASGQPKIALRKRQHLAFSWNCTLARQSFQDSVLTSSYCNKAFRSPFSRTYCFTNHIWSIQVLSDREKFSRIVRSFWRLYFVRPSFVESAGVLELYFTTRKRYLFSVEWNDAFGV